MKCFWVVACFLLVIALFPQPTYARHAGVLADTTTESGRIDLSLSEGPGNILPNSPFYFLDIWQKNAQLFLTSFDPTAQAKLHLQIANQRIVEIKTLIDTKQLDAKGLDVALRNLEENLEGARRVLKDEKNKGKNVENLAESLSDTVRLEQESLTKIGENVGEDTKLKLRAAQVKIEKEAIEIEDELSPQTLERKIKDDLRRGIKDQTEVAKKASERAAALTGEYNAEASKAGLKRIKEAEMKLKEASKLERKKIELQLMEKKKLLKMQEQSRLEAKRKAEEAAKRVHEAQQAVEQEEQQENVDQADTNQTGNSATSSNTSN